MRYQYFGSISDDKKKSMRQEWSVIVPPNRISTPLRNTRSEAARDARAMQELGVRDIMKVRANH